jgi:hypothetical protein
MATAGLPAILVQRAIIAEPHAIAQIHIITGIVSGKALINFSHFISLFWLARIAGIVDFKKSPDYSIQHILVILGCAAWFNVNFAYVNKLSP